MAQFDHDVTVIGSGFGGSVAALRAAEKGYRVGILESGKRCRVEEPTAAHFAFFHWPRRQPAPRSNLTSKDRPTKMRFRARDVMAVQRAPWYASIVSDVKALDPTAAPSLESVFVEIDREQRADPYCALWYTVAAIIADALDRSASCELSAPHRRLQSFLSENRDLFGA